MELQLKNIGMIKEANVKIDGLTVIAGENDTGKSTVSKVLFCMINGINRAMPRNDEQESDNKTFISNFLYMYSKLFKDFKLPKNSYVKLSDNLSRRTWEIEREYISGNINEVSHSSSGRTAPDFLQIAFIESPLIWNFTEFFRDISQIESQIRIELDYPYLMKDLNFKLHIKSALNGIDVKKQMTDLMRGEFKKDEMGRYYFDKQGQRIELVNTATGIKTFGVFQVLSQNHWLNENTVLILDEPEVHLHPEWQLEMARIIVELVKDGVKIVVNSHSPYMIEALKRYSEVEKIDKKTNFYLAKDGFIAEQESLENIFETLALPMRKLKKLKMDRYLND